MAFTDGSGVTDWISNVTRLTPDWAEDPRPWLTPIATGNGRLLTFLHEATHNWCFNSAVVHAQMYVAGRAEMNALVYLMLQDDPEPGESSGPAHDLRMFGQFIRDVSGDPRRRLGERVAEVRDRLGLHVHDDVVRLEVAGALLRPLAEGLALFAEYDAMSRLRSRAWSPLPVAVALNFAGRERFQALAERGPLEPNVTTTKVVGELLHEARLSEWAVTTKASLLRAPFRSEGGGYLPGYLTVKSMWRFLFQQDFRLYGESDIVLTYLRTFFFEDVELAAELLAPPISNVMLSTDRLIGAFNRRMQAFFDEATPRDLAEFEAALDSEGPVGAAGTLRTADEHEQARQRFAGQVAALESSEAARLSEFAYGTAVTSVNSLMALRTFVTVMSVEVEVDEKGTVTWQGREVLEVAPADVVRPASGPHTLDILLGMSGDERMSRLAVISRERTSRLALVGREQELHSVTVVMGLPDQREALRGALLSSFASRAKRESSARSLQFTAEAIVAEDWGLRMNRDHVRDQLREVVDQLYHDVALRYSSGYEAMDACGELMAAKGLRPLLGTTEALRGAAFLGLAAGLNSYRDVLETQFEKRGMDLPSLLDTLSRGWNEHGFPPRIHESADERPILIPFI
ncbi:hypothetical protein JIG36_08755 [Actinoplanes sp. LDG1-06]|uniref:Uncharacterized protein n=1 Tax=Paractinoplanes ovalisporus TaxID=2810368 RepID=A0ABS2A730_9ACTN|nr:hypothetical protein [Actinoplanes ovalisporus]MBM2615640.1 hypothetical protein [Actinoplanes ovalisporus]